MTREERDAAVAAFHRYATTGPDKEAGERGVPLSRLLGAFTAGWRAARRYQERQEGPG